MTPSPTPAPPALPDQTTVPWFGCNGRSFVPATYPYGGAARPGSKIAEGDRLCRREASLIPDVTARDTPKDQDVDTGCLRPASQAHGDAL